MRYYAFKTGLGWVGILASSWGLLAVTLPNPSVQAARQSLGARTDAANWVPEAFNDLLQRLQAYYRGRRVDFADELDLTGATPFQRAVWTVTQGIPYGETRSYRWVAEQMGQPQAARAVGQALGRNPLTIIVPCHRVLASDGGLGGFGGGLEMKRQLLRLEGARDRQG